MAPNTEVLRANDRFKPMDMSHGASSSCNNVIRPYMLISQASRSGAVFDVLHDHYKDEKVAPLLELQVKSLPLRTDFASDLILVLDLDRCLIYTDKKMPTRQTFLRPVVIPFLQQVSARYETHIFTAALPCYANPILDALVVAAELKRDFAGRWFRDSTTQIKKGIYWKDLATLNLPQHASMKRMVLVDDRYLNFVMHPANGIPVRPFVCKNPHDDSLEKTRHLLMELEAAQAFRIEGEEPEGAT